MVAQGSFSLVQLSMKGVSQPGAPSKQKVGGGRVSAFIGLPGAPERAMTDRRKPSQGELQVNQGEA